MRGFVYWVQRVGIPFYTLSTMEAGIYLYIGFLWIPSASKGFTPYFPARRQPRLVIDRNQVLESGAFVTALLINQREFLLNHGYERLN